MIAIINYGSGNLRAICNVLDRIGVTSRVVTIPEDIADAEKILLPGVGAFDQAMCELNQSGLRNALDHAVLVERKPILGICVGMQMFANNSEEGKLPGLGWLNASVMRFPDHIGNHPLQLPHMGWNTAIPSRQDPLLGGIDMVNGFYFLHSYYFKCVSPEDELTSTKYGFSFTSAVRKNNIYGVQFHPEKSHNAGVQVLRNFAHMK